MNLKEKLDSFVPDRILYEKEWNCKDVPTIGSYDRFFRPFDRTKKPKKIKLLETRPEHCEYWKYLYSNGEVKYVLHGHDEKEYRCCHAVIPNGYVQINLHHDSVCYPYESISLILDNGRRYVEMLYSRRQIEKDGFANPWGEITESILSDDGLSFDQYRKSSFFYDHKKYIKGSDGDFCYTVVDSKYISKHRFFEYNQPESPEEKEEQEQCYQRFLMAGFQEV